MDDGGAFGKGPGGGLNPAQLQSLVGALGIGAAQTPHDARDVRGERADGRDARDVRSQTGRDSGRQGAGAKQEQIEFHGEGRLAGPGAAFEPATLAVDATGITIVIGSARPVRANYRDLSMIAIQQATVMLLHAVTKGR